MSKKYYTTEEDKFILDNYNKMTDKEIAEKLGRTANGICNRRLRLLERNSIDDRKHKEHSWSEDDVKYLTDNISLLTTKEIAKHLGRSEAAVTNKIHRIKKQTAMKDQQDTMNKVLKEASNEFLKADEVNLDAGDNPVAATSTDFDGDVMCTVPVDDQKTIITAIVTDTGSKRILKGAVTQNTQYNAVDWAWDLYCRTQYTMSQIIYDLADKSGILLTFDEVELLLLKANETNQQYTFKLNCYYGNDFIDKLFTGKEDK